MSPLGCTPDEIWNAYTSAKPRFSRDDHENVLVSRLSSASEQFVKEIAADVKYKSLDRSVLMAIAASRMAVNSAGWDTNSAIGINIGSSRGATGLFEHHHAEFIRSGKAKTLASPTTTLGNISSWIAQDLQSNGPEISHSITCSTGLHAVLNGIAWLQSGMADKFLVGASEAPLTPFTIAQMQAMKIYSRFDDAFPCKAMDLNKSANSMILGEAASVAAIVRGKTSNALAVIEGIGYATEQLTHSTSISAEAVCFQKSMAMALSDTDHKEVDAIVMHAPGTIAGDKAEMAALEKVFGIDVPPVTGNKWLCGHTFATSGMLSIEMAVMMMQHNQFIIPPYLAARKSRPLRKVLVNSVGFGGNAVSVLVSKN